MPRYVAFLRGVSPLNAKSPDLRRCFEAAGFAAVTTVLGSGNVVFSCDSAPETEIERRTQAATADGFGHAFPAFVRSQDELRELVAADPFAGFDIGDGKRVVTFLRQPPSPIELPITYAGATIWGVANRMAFTSYLPNPTGPQFMTLIERTFTKDVTTRTWQTIIKCAAV